MMRIDRWLWCARFFKTRGLAADAVKAGHVRIDGQRSKPAKTIALGAALTIVKGEETWRVTVTNLPQRRGPAAEARACYEEAPESIERRLEQRRARKASVQRPPTPGRPDRRTRRLIRAQRGRR